MNKAIDAAKAAIDVGRFDMADEILRRGNVPLCRLCLQRASDDYRAFRLMLLPICTHCSRNGGVGRLVTGLPGPSRTIEWWIRDYRGRKHYEDSGTIEEHL